MLHSPCMWSSRYCNFDWLWTNPRTGLPCQLSCNHLARMIDIEHWPLIHHNFCLSHAHAERKPYCVYTGFGGSCIVWISRDGTRESGLYVRLRFQFLSLRRALHCQIAKTWEINIETISKSQCADLIPEEFEFVLGFKMSDHLKFCCIVQLHLSP